MTGKVLDVKQDCKHRFGEYVHVSANVLMEKSNDTDVLQTILALATHPLCNDQGSHRYFSLNTGRIITSSHAVPLPTPSSCIDTLHEMAASEPKHMTFSH